MSQAHTSIHTLGALIESGYKFKSIKQEIRDNLLMKFKNGEKVFENIHGYEDTVIPDIERALLARHNILLLGLRGQAKTKIARLMTNLLDEYVPYIAGSEINDDPFHPISKYALDLIAEKGNDTPIAWLHRHNRYAEKLATPDVTVADLIGDSDPIKAANLKLSYADERVIHFGLIPRSNRCIFVINELPDLQARIQVSLFNILQEGDIQIRGFKIRLPLDIQFVFTANPEDYTNRGSIVTPLKDRIQSQILTHYPKSIAISKDITQGEVNLLSTQRQHILVHDLLKDMVEQIAFEARKSEFVDAKSGVSARLTISAYESMVASAERRMLLAGEENTHVRIADLFGVMAAITGKIELVYEGEQEGAALVAHKLIKKALRSAFATYFPDPEKLRKQKQASPFQAVLDWFAKGNSISIVKDAPEAEYKSELELVDGLSEIVLRYQPSIAADEPAKLLFMEFLLHGMAEHSMISKHQLEVQTDFSDLMSSMFNFSPNESEDLNYDEE